MNEENNNDCLICLDTVNNNDNFVLCTNCNYYCHYECSSKWFKSIHTHNYYCIHCQQNDSLVVYTTKKFKKRSCIDYIKKFILRVIK